MEKKSFETVLHELEKLWTDQNAPILPTLNPGGTDSLLKLFSKFSLPEHLLQLYGWHNGTSLDLPIFTLGFFVSIERMAEIYNYMAGEDEFWKLSMVPIFESRAGEFYLIDCDERSEKYGTILKYYPGSVDFKVIIDIYDSLESLFKTILECFQQEAYSYEPDPFLLVLDFQLSFKIAIRNNPKSTYWNQIFDLPLDID